MKISLYVIKFAVECVPILSPIAFNILWKKFSSLTKYPLLKSVLSNILWEL